ncbi:streptophobe family protein [Kitasatospora sp. NPDC057015]|uniref:streptophobe family protein n=1 Tax=Kitasatospora sp. NPDC057015 TaxID=3346001 RepID=UPI00363FC3ED
MHQEHRPGPEPAPGVPPAPGRPGAPGLLRGWLDALAVVLAGLVAMTALAALGLLLAHAGSLPQGSFPSVLAATLALAVGGSVRIDGGAGFFAKVDAGITVMPLSVGLAGALVMVEVFLRQLRFRAVAPGRELLGRIARVVVLWLAALAVIVSVARHTFVVELGGDLIGTIGGVLGLTPEVGFHADVPRTLGFGLLWLLVVLAVAFAVSRRAPLPRALLPYQYAVRPAAFAMLVVLLVYAVLGVVVGVVTALVHGNAGETLAVVLLAVPNLAWPAFGLGLGAQWHGHLTGAIGLPMPQVLADVLRTPDGREVTVSVASLAGYDGRIWWLTVLAAVLLLAAGFLMAHRSPEGVPLWQHAVRMGLALAVTMLLIGVLSRVSASYGLAVLGVNPQDDGLGGLLGSVLGGSAAQSLGNGSLSLQPYWWGVPLAAGWGLLAGALGALLASRVRRRGEVPAPGGQDG